MNQTERYDLSVSEWAKLIDEWIFNERHRKILKRRLLDGICFEPLAEEFGMSSQQIKTIVYNGMKKLIKHI